MNQPQGKQVTEEIGWSKEFPITSVTRADIVAAGFSQQIVEALTDEEIKEIASAMEDVYCDHGYWEDLELCTRRLLEEKEQDYGTASS